MLRQHKEGKGGTESKNQKSPIEDQATGNSCIL